MIRLSFLPLLAVLSLVTAPLFAQQAYTVQSSEVDMQVIGTSNLHDWECVVEQVDGSGSIMFANGALTGIRQLEIQVLVTSIKSGKTQMDNNTYKAMKANAHPNLTYTLLKVNSIQPEGKGWVLTTTGTLQIAGQTNTIELQVKASPGANGQLLFAGSIPVHMPDYGIDPPSALFGTITTGEDVTVEFQVPMATAQPN